MRYEKILNIVISKYAYGIYTIIYILEKKVLIVKWHLHCGTDELSPN